MKILERSHSSLNHGLHASLLPPLLRDGLQLVSQIVFFVSVVHRGLQAWNGNWDIWWLNFIRWLRIICFDFLFIFIELINFMLNLTNLLDIGSFPSPDSNNLISHICQLLFNGIFSFRILQRFTFSLKHCCFADPINNKNKCNYKSKDDGNIDEMMGL